MPTKHTKNPPVFTLGYELRNIEQFVELLLAEDIDVLLDVRETAWSHKPGFSKTALSTTVERRGIEYHHVNWVGNPKWIRSVADSHEDCLGLYREHLEATDGLADAFVEMMASLLQQGLRVCLVCYERHPGDCHRGVLAELVENRINATIQHIAPEGRPRMIAS